MKIKTINKSLEDVIKLPQWQIKKIRKQSFFFRHLINIVAKKDLKECNFTYTTTFMDKLDSSSQVLYLMNHSSFIDLEIVARLLHNRKYHIVCTEDGLVGQYFLLSRIGCIPTKKFVRDVNLIRRIKHCLYNLHSSVIMFPEASYTFDGTTTRFTDNVAKCIKMLKVPIVIIKTEGAFLREPLYNNLQKRKINVSANMEYVLSKDDIEKMSVKDIDLILQEKFEYDHFKNQQQNNIIVNESFRADSLNRVLYKCPHCGTEGMMIGKNIYIECKKCGIKYELKENGFLEAINGHTIFNHIPDWYKWEREKAKEEVLNDTYLLDCESKVYCLKGFKAMYYIGIYRLIHNSQGLKLLDKDNNVIYEQSSLFSYSLYSDFNWYELGDVIVIGNEKIRYYVFPNKKDVVAKARLIQEEAYKYQTSNISLSEDN